MERVLAAIDGSAASLRAARAAAELALHFGARLTLLHVVRHPGTVFEALPVSPDEEDMAKRDARRLLKRLAGQLEAPGLRVETLVLEGDPAARIQDAAERLHADVVVLGRRERARLARWFFGSTSESVTHHCGRSVLVVH